MSATLALDTFDRINITKTKSGIELISQKPKVELSLYFAVLMAHMCLLKKKKTNNLVQVNLIFIF